ncbi:MAG TPA: hypothetical protein VHZ50_01820 [Puia sp.]|jgi:hypothetical protein|nr:hypothetical protein [Puia sp.]
MKGPNIALLVNKRGGPDVFDSYAREIEQAAMEGDLAYELNDLKIIMNKIQGIERRLQDLGEFINAANENKENIYELTIEKSRQLLHTWLGLFKERNKYPSVINSLNVELDKLDTYVLVSNIETKTVDEIKTDFETQFILDDNILDLYTESVDYKAAIDANDFEKLSELNSFILAGLYSRMRARISGLIDKHIDKLGSISDDIANSVYTCEIEIWIDTNDAVEANKFMHLVSSTLSYIDGVELHIVDAKIGSFLQRWRARFADWSSKEETKQILKKGTAALESYALERHIEPIEKSKVERKKTEEDLKRMMSEAQAIELNKLIIEEKKEDLKSKKLLNIKQELEIRNTLSDMLTRGLIDTDSDFKIMINGMLLVKKENQQIEIGDVDDIDLKGEQSA